MTDNEARLELVEISADLARIRMEEYQLKLRTAELYGTVPEECDEFSIYELHECWKHGCKLAGVDPNHPMFTQYNERVQRGIEAELFSELEA